VERITAKVRGRVKIFLILSPRPPAAPLTLRGALIDLNNMKKYIFTGIGLIAIDQITKQGAEYFLAQQSIPITDWFRFFLTYNEGIAFSLPFPRIFLIGLTIGFVIFFIKSFWRTFNNVYQRWSGTLIVAGAIGNLIDRILFGSVIDFLSFWSFPVFNVADILISVGVFGLILLEVFPLGHNHLNSMDDNG
jgi:signal peptidase II